MSARVPLSLGLAALLAAGALAGCVAPELAPASTGTPLDEVLGAVSLLESGGFSMDVPVEVYLLGFPPEVAPALAAKLQPEEVDHSAGSLDRAFPPDPEAMPLGGPSWPAPTQGRAVFQVVDLGAAANAAFLEAAAGWKVPDGEGNVFDANLAEPWIAAQVEAARGAPLDRQAPVFVILHADALGEHGWRYTYANGYLEPIRIFGEFLPVTVFDVSAVPDPYFYNDDLPTSPLGLVFYAAFGPDPTRRYDVPIEASGDETIDILRELAVDAAHYRFLKGPLYPISTKPCHHVSLVLAVHQTSATQQLPGFAKAEEMVDVEGLRSAFVNLTGDEVTIEMRTLVLPQDEPVLDALTRQAAAFVTLDALRWYLDENWASFVTPSDGCEEYLSVLLLADPASHTRMFGGIGTYDVLRGHRISFSIVTDVSRIQRSIDGPAPVSTKDASENWDAVDLLYSHEIGHTFGQHHPQHLSRSDGASAANHAFESVYSVMAYEPGTRTIDFGAVDHATWTRGRAGYAIADAQALGLEGTPEFQAALDHLAKGHWTAAYMALEPMLAQQGATDEGGARLPVYEVHDWHQHPWG